MVLTIKYSDLRRLSTKDMQDKIKYIETQTKVGKKV
jgi:hypothetical protein